MTQARPRGTTFLVLVFSTFCATNERTCGFPNKIKARRDGRVVDGGGLENHCTGNGAGGSNPSPSAKSLGKSSIQPQEWGKASDDVFAIVRFLSVSFLPALLGRLLLRF